jgi:transposase InsO family protein
MREAEPPEERAPEVRRSTDRKSNRLNNDKAKSFFSWAGGNPERFTREPDGYINWYSTRRIKMRLDWNSPIAYLLK